LLVYLKDSEEKTGVFDKLIDRMELFTDILNNRRFTFKTIRINREKGFVFLTSKGKNLNLTDLSSGEQHEVVLLYELIFKAKQNTLVLIDEPEISLHISWQTEFLEDLLQIIKLQNIQIIIATHSPQIINDNWHLTVDLAKQVNL
jgi:predicted ATP-binding protein involved in virulence